MRVGIVSVGIGNVASVKNMIEKTGHAVELLSNPPTVPPDVVVLPGVGAYDNAVTRLEKAGWMEFLRAFEERTNGRGRLIGICLGMQLLCDGSDEGNKAGLGIIPGYFKRFSFSGEEASSRKVPHMGWNEVRFDTDKANWAKGLPQGSRFYFVHSFYYTHEVSDYVAGTTAYGIEYGSVILRRNTVGFQFHPEKSHRFGRCLLSTVLESTDLSGQ